MHEGHYFDPSLRDIEAMITSSQQRVSGETRVHLAAGRWARHGLAQPLLDDGPQHRDLWRGEPSLDRRRGKGLCPRAAIPEFLAMKAGEKGGQYMVRTTRVRLNRIASSTKNAALATEVIVGDEIIAQEGYVLAVRILTDKSSYNTVEDLSAAWSRSARATYWPACSARAARSAAMPVWCRRRCRSATPSTS